MVFSFPLFSTFLPLTLTYQLTTLAPTAQTSTNLMVPLASTSTNSMRRAALCGPGEEGDCLLLPMFDGLSFDPQRALSNIAIAKHNLDRLTKWYNFTPVINGKCPPFYSSLPNLFFHVRLHSSSLRRDVLHHSIKLFQESPDFVVIIDHSSSPIPKITYFHVIQAPLLSHNIFLESPQGGVPQTSS